MVGVRWRQFWAKRKGWSVTRTERLRLRGVPSQFSLLLYTIHRGWCQLIVHRAWWQSGFGCLVWDLIEISSPVSRDPYNLRRRPGLRSCPNSHLPSDFLGGRKFLPKHWSCPLLRLQERSAAGIVVQSLPKFGWGKRQCPLLDRIRFWTTWQHNLLWRMWEPRESFSVHHGTIPGLGVCRESRSSGMHGRCDVFC